MASCDGPYPASLPSDHAITHGCERSRSTIRMARSRNGAGVGRVLAASDPQRPWVSMFASSTTYRPSSSHRS